MLLAKNSFHLSLLDAVAGTTEKYKLFLKQWNTYRQMMLEIEHLKEELLRKEKDKDYYAFLVQEIDELNTKAGENDELETRLLVLRNAEKIRLILHESSAGLKYDENNICGMIRNLSEKLRSVSDFFPVLGDFDQRLKSAIVEIDDIATELSVLHEKIDDNPAELAATEERLSEIHRLLFKHQQNDSDGLLKVKNEMANRLSEIDLCSEQIDTLQKQAGLLLEIISKQAEELSQARRVAIPALEKSISDILHVLAMPHAVFRAECRRDEQLSAKGYDHVIFQFSANKGEATQELSKVASGGEMSRVMLALKSVIARSSSLPTLVFDEIDSGVSGETAKKMAGIFQEMGENIQLVVITHLPQVAAKAQHHLLVSKADIENSTVTVMKELHPQGRVVEIAKMLGGENFTESTILTVKELMQN
jgi:DNA repair protein RecN (Recombination protein N)